MGGAGPREQGYNAPFMQDADSQRTRLRIPRFVVQSGTLQLVNGTSVTVGVQPVFVGRSPDCALVLTDPEASALHCEFQATDLGVRIRDLGSRNGVYVGGVRITDAVVTSRCVIEIADTKIAFIPSARESLPVAEQESLGPLVGRSTSMRRLFRVVGEVGPTDLSVLIHGETGTGKELVAQAIHESSPRAKGPFVVVDCAAIPPTLAESMLFGHEKGAFTGAGEARPGAFHEAHGGTIFIDELGELPADLQPKLLRALAEKKIKRVGGTGYKAVDVRVVAAGRRDLAAMMNRDEFRSDLYFRIAQVNITLPPLRERREDIPLIVRRVCDRNGRPERADDVLRLVEGSLSGYDWPGNVRELVNVTSVASSLPAGSSVTEDLLRLERAAPTIETSVFAEAKRAALDTFERRFFTELAQTTGVNITEMARRSGLSRQYVRSYLRKHGLVE